MNYAVTIGLCIKNAEETINAALESVLNQDFIHSQMELIVVVGRSKDQTLMLAEKFLAKTDLEYKIFTEDSGLGKARQIVVDTARGNYIMWVDGDMTMSADYVRKQVAFMDQHSFCGIARGRYSLNWNQPIVSLLENIVYVVDSEYGVKSASKLGYLPPTGGSIYRVKTIKAVGGFDRYITGAGEDIEVAFRIKAAGWSICLTDAKFYPQYRQTWSALWNQYFWYGYGGHFIMHKNSDALTFYKMVPPAGFFAGVLRSLEIYKLTHKKIFLLLLPVHYVFKRMAWSVGFFRSHINDYGHNLQPVPIDTSE